MHEARWRRGGPRRVRPILAQPATGNRAGLPGAGSEFQAELGHQHPRAQRNFRPDELTGRDVGRPILVRKVATRKLRRPVVAGDTECRIVGRVTRDVVAEQGCGGYRLAGIIPTREARRLVALRTYVAGTYPGEGFVFAHSPIVACPDIEHPWRRE